MTLPERPIQAVLFACNLNCVRSPMAEGLFKRRFAKRVYADSVGVRPGSAVDPLAVEALDELGVDLSRHRPKGFDALDDMNFDLVVSLTPEAHHRAVELTRLFDIGIEYWPTFDPTLSEGARAQRLEEYRAVRDQLDQRIAKRFAMLSTF